MQHANVYDRRGTLFVLPSSLTTAGVWISTDPVVKLDNSAAPDQIGRIVLDALGGSKDNVQHPLDPNKPTSSILKTARARSWSEFERNTRLVTVELDDQRLNFFPWRNSAPKPGYEPMGPQHEIMLLASSNASEIGMALKVALSRSR